MFSWLKSKMQNSRTYMCIKEVKWDLEQRDSSQIAQILIVAQNLRFEIFKGDEEIRKILDNPFIASRNHLIELYNVLENTRKSAEYQLKQIKQFVGKENFPNFSQEQFTIGRRGWHSLT
ncbi:MAG: hypothetical protein GY821_05000 [Gammaproteobacteria bacterium]|nr:hypothetical protein [Gammaproteobacteria bacterium]